ncbi:MAG: hypothetical protein R3F56_07375 [Planctomycetota bacterium]
MSVLACVLSVAIAQNPAPPREDPFVRLGVEADLQATTSARHRPTARLPEAAAPLLARRMLDHPTEAAARAEEFVRAALSEIQPAPVLAAALVALGERREPEPNPVAGMDARRFEAVLEHAHREVVRALGSGRDVALMAPALQVATARHLQPGALDGMAEEERGALRTALARAGKVDRAALVAQAIVLVQAARALVDGGAAELRRAPTKPGERGVVGGVVLDRSTSFGRFVIGGSGRNQYECGEIAVIVDLGGDDEYRGQVAAAGMSRRLSLVVDVDGDDTYRGQNDALGSAAFGVGILIDFAGDDHYFGSTRCAGFGAAGVGALFDLGGDDEMTLERDSGGVGLAGIGLVLDVGSGKDVTRVTGRSLGVGLPGGLGMFVDDGGNDARVMMASDVPATLCCGAGVGVNRWLGGGLGVFVDVGGEDRYEGGDLVCGAGVEGGAGVFLEAAGKDHYQVGQLALGGGRDHGLGVFVDAAGDDEYHASGPSLGCAFAFGVGWAEERSGRDLYDLRGAWPGWADAGALGAFFELAGGDRYRVTTQPVLWSGDAEKAMALAVFEDRGGDADLYEGGESPRPPCEGTAHRQVVPGSSGQVVRVLVDD